MEQIQAIMEAAKETDSPVIIQASRGARAYSQDNYLKHLMLAASELYPQIPTVMHQDHGNSPATCASAIANNFTSVMMDGSLKEDGKTPADYAYNMDVTRRVVDMAHSCGVSVEGELDASVRSNRVTAKTATELKASCRMTNCSLTQTGRAVLAETGVDALAVAIGTSHGRQVYA
jgi:fructose-bisphosphate aldolase class II